MNLSGQQRLTARAFSPPKAAPPGPGNWRRAADDVAAGVGAWQMWLLLACNDIRQRYLRSRLGQFWITLSTAIFVAGIGVLYAYLFRQPIGEYIPYLSVNIVVWTLIAGIITDSTSVFTQAGPLLEQQALPKTVFVMRLIMRQLIVLAHNLVIVAAVHIIFGVAPTAALILILPGLGLLLVAAFLSATTIGLLCARFRDLPQIVSSLMQVAFFLTPVMWQAEQLGERAHYVVGYNPFAIFLLLVAGPLHGEWPPADLYARALIVIAAMALVAAPLFARYRARIVYWL